MKAIASNRTAYAFGFRFLALAGVAGPFVYAAVVAVLGRLYPGYSHLSQTMSELGAADAPHALIMNIAGLGLLGIMIMAFAAALHQGSSQSGRTIFGTVLIAASGAALVMTAVFPCDTGGEITTAGRLHGVFAAVGSVCMVVGMLITAFILYKDSQWRDCAILSVTIALLASALAALYGLDIIEGWKGALQRVSMGVALLWVVVVAVRLLRLPQSVSASSQRSPVGPS